MNSTPVSARSLISASIWPYRWYLAAQLTGPVIWAIDRSLAFYFTKKMIDLLSQGHATSASLAFYALGYIISTAAVIIAYRSYDWCFLHIAPRIEQTITTLLIERLLKSSYHFYQGQIAGSLANQIREVANGVPALLDICLKQFIAPLCGIIIGLSFLASVNGIFALILFLWVILVLCTFAYCLPHVKHRSIASAQAANHVLAQNADIFTNIMSVRLFGTKDEEIKHVKQATNLLVHAEKKRGLILLGMILFQNFGFLVCISSCLWFLISGSLAGSIVPGDFALILGTSGIITMCMWFLFQNIPMISRIYGLINQGLSVIVNAPTVSQNPNAISLKVSHGSIVFNNVTFQYQPEDLPFFNNLSVAILPGQKVGLVGYSGAGKSTFVNLILRLFDVQHGQIFIDDQDISQVTYQSLIRSIAFIPQDPHLFHRSLYDNIAYGQPEATEQAVIEAAKKAYAHDFIIKTAHQYQTIVGDRGIKLSGGQKQRIAIARAILKNAPILLMDEATSQLDSSSEQYIQKSLWETTRGKTTLVIAHRLSTLLHLDRIIVFDKGAIVEDGTHEQLLARNGLYTSLWNHQINGFLPDNTNI